MSLSGNGTFVDFLLSIDIISYFITKPDYFARTTALNMKWYEGSISEAIRLAKTKGSVFVVYIYDESEASTKLNESFAEPAVDELCVGSNSVAIRLEVKSEAGVQFSQIYPVVIVPCVFFIGNNGIPLEVVGGYLTPAELLQKFSRAVELHHSSSAAAPMASQPPTAAASTAPVAAASSNPESSGPSAAAAIHEPVPGPSGTTSEFTPDDDSSAGSTKETLEQKKQKALQLLARKREEKAREEEENEKQREVERRELGQNMVKLKQLKEERDRREIENSYKKKKEEDRLARERVLADLERDRQERALRFRQEKVDKEVTVMKAKSEKLAAQAEEEARQLAAKRESARIQYRLPDGSTLTQVFSSSEPLATCQTFILQRLGWSKVTLSTIYPKRTFTEADMSQTLLDLELAPSAAIVVLPSSSDKSRGGSDGGGGGGIMAIFWMLLAPLLALWALINNFLFAAPLPTVGATGSTPAQSANSRAPPTGNAPQDSDQPSASARRRTTGTGSDGLKRHQDGNVRRFTANDDEDENATWNGNSTQQM